MKIVAVIALLLIAVSGPAHATTLFTFTGENGLAGEFLLDETASFAVFENSVDQISGILQSPLQSIRGHFGPYTFEGLVTLHVFDRLTPYPPSSFEPDDFWIVRAFPPNFGSLTGPPINGVSPTYLNLFIFTSPSVPIGLDVTPPPITKDPFHFQYSFGLSDGTNINGALTTLVLVPEPATLYCLAVGIGLVVLGRSRHRRFRRTR